MKRTIPVLCAALLVVATGLWAQTGFHKGGRMMRHGRFAAGAGMPQPIVDKLTSELGLTKAQQASWKELRDKQSATMKPLAETARQKHEAIRDGLDNNADAATLGQLLIDAHNLRQQMRAAHQQYEKSFTALLNSDQVAKYQEIRQRFHHGHGHGGDDDGPPPPL